MHLSQEALKEFEKLLKEDYPDEKFTKEQILEMATRVFRAIELIHKPIPNKEAEKFRRLNHIKKTICKNQKTD